MYADPTVYVEDGKYYLTGTRSGSPLGFVLLQSDDLHTWVPSASPDSMILSPGDGVFGTKGFWAPQILHNPDGTYTLTYTADEQVNVAHSPTLARSFRQSVTGPIDPSEKNIDSYIYRDTDGRYYLYHVRFDHGNYIWVAEYDPEKEKIVEGTLSRCFANTQPWEKTDDYPSDPIMEGPAVTRIGDTYYLFYSANHFMSRDYAVGYATAPAPMGPWTKYEGNPIIHRSTVGENGSGHGDLFTDLDGKLRYVYHVHNSDSVVSPRRTRIVTLRLDSTASANGGPAILSVDPRTIIKPVNQK